MDCGSLEVNDGIMEEVSLPFPVPSATSPQLSPYNWVSTCFGMSEVARYQPQSLFIVLEEETKESGLKCLW